MDIEEDESVVVDDNATTHHVEIDIPSPMSSRGSERRLLSLVLWMSVIGKIVKFFIDAIVRTDAVLTSVLMYFWRLLKSALFWASSVIMVSFISLVMIDNLIYGRLTGQLIVVVNAFWYLFLARFARRKADGGVNYACYRCAWRILSIYVAITFPGWINPSTIRSSPGSTLLVLAIIVITNVVCVILSVFRPPQLVALAQYICDVSSSSSSPNVYKVHITRQARPKSIYLAVMGSIGSYTASTLDTLDRHACPATWFILGGTIEDKKHLVRRIGSSSPHVAHRLASNTWSGRSVANVDDEMFDLSVRKSKESLTSSVVRLQSIAKGWIAVHPNLNWRKSFVDMLKSSGYSAVMKASVTPICQWPEANVAGSFAALFCETALILHLKAWFIVLEKCGMADTFGPIVRLEDSALTHAVLKQMIPWWKSKGWNFAALPNLQPSLSQTGATIDVNEKHL